jgi:hypothetical protein
VEAAARALGPTGHVVQVRRDDRNFYDAFATLRKKSVDALHLAK